MTFTIRRIIEDYIRAPANPISEFYDVEDDNDLYILFVDFEKAYDTVPRRVLYYLLREKYDIPEHIVALIRKLHERLELAPAVQKHTGGSFTPKVGLQQGGVMSPTLWNLYLNCVEVETRKRTLGSAGDALQGRPPAHSDPDERQARKVPNTNPRYGVCRRLDSGATWTTKIQTSGSRTVHRDIEVWTSNIVQAIQNQCDARWAQKV